jgi:hypothetical protein
MLKGINCNPRPGSGKLEFMSKSSVLAELWQFLRVRKKMWLMPILVFLGLIGLLVILSESSAVAPFIYALF